MRGYIRAFAFALAVVSAVTLSGAAGAALADEVNPTSGSSPTTPSILAITPTPMTSEVPSNGPLTISVSPTSGPPGTAVTVRGTGWTHQTYADGVPIEIAQNYGNGQLTLLTTGKSGPPDASGVFNLRMTIPTNAKPGLLSISPITGGPEISDALFTVTSGGASSGQVQAHPSVTLSPSNGPPGTVTTADGHGFTPNQSVKVTQSGGPGVTGGGGTVQAHQSGSIKMSFRISDQTPPGVITVTFKQSTNVVTAQFRVTASQPTQGTSGPTFVCGGEPCGRPRPSQDQLPNPPQWLTSPNAAACLISVGAIDLDASLTDLQQVSGEQADLAKTKGLLDPNYWLVQLKAFANSATFPECREWIKELKRGK